MSAPVEIESLSKRFGELRALHSVSLSIPRGQVFGLLGPNGAGKSTLIRLLMGFLRPTSGRARIDGMDSYHQRVAVHQRVAYLPGDARLQRMMKASSVLQLYCQFRAQASFSRGRQVADRLELDLNRWVGLMSTGMRQKLALAITLAADVPLLILDEPTANLDPTVRGQVLELVREAKADGRTVIFSSHVLSEIEETCDRVAILKQGELVYQESMAHLSQHHRIRARLLGPLPEIPHSLTGLLQVGIDGNRVQIETPGELSPVLRWLASASLDDMHVQPVGLRAVYDRFHRHGQVAGVPEVRA